MVHEKKLNSSINEWNHIIHNFFSAPFVNSFNKKNTFSREKLISLLTGSSEKVAMQIIEFTNLIQINDKEDRGTGMKKTSQGKLLQCKNQMNTCLPRVMERLKRITGTPLELHQQLRKKKKRRKLWKRWRYKNK